MVQPKPHTAATEVRIDRTNRPIDLVHLARQTLGDRSLETEVLWLFEKQVSLYFERVRNTTDPKEIAMGLHTLKGASVGVGAVVLAEQARAAEEEFSSTGGIDPETLDDLAMAVEEVCAYIRGLVGQDID